MSSPYRENPMHYIAVLTKTEVEQAILEFVSDRSNEDFENATVRLKVALLNEAGTYEVTAEVVGWGREV